MPDRDHANILENVAAYYSTKIQEFGPTSKGVDWRDESSHVIRHRQFLYLIREEFDAHICDLGCGYGHFLSFLRASGFTGQYTGYDISPDMLAAARAHHGDNDKQRWKLASKPEGRYDFTIASGIFNVRPGAEESAWETYIFDTIEVMHRASDRGFAFNLLSTSSDPDRRRQDLYYADPVKFLVSCTSRYGRRVALLQDTDLFEFTMIIRNA